MINEGCFFLASEIYMLFCLVVYRYPTKHWFPYDAVNRYMIHGGSIKKKM